MKKDKLKNMAPWVGLFLLTGCVWVLYHQLREYRLSDILANLKAIPRGNLIYAFLITLFDFVVLIGCEILSFQYVKKPLAGHRIALTSFIAYSFSNCAGFSGFSGASVRYRFYSAWGLSGIDIAKLIAFVNSSFAFGFLLLAGTALTWSPFNLPENLHFPFASSLPLGIFFLAIVAVYFIWIYASKKSFKINDWEFELPAFRLSFFQTLLSAFDFLLLGAIFYVLLPAHTDIPFAKFTAIYLLALAAGIISQIPGGLGVFETVILLTFPAIDKTSLMGSLLAYRTIYYLFPFCLGAFMLGIHELRHRREQLKEMGDYFTNMTLHFSPVFISIAIFLGGIVLLVSGATPHAVERAAWLKDILPLPVMEISHFLGSLAGACLLILAWAIQRRLNAAYLLTIALLGTGIVLSLAKGLDYEEALILSLMLGMILPCRRHFYRKTSLVNEPFSLSWLLAILLAFSASVWLGLFAYKHINYSHDLWWKFELHANAPRFMRASVGASVALLLFALIRLLTPSRPKRFLSNNEELEKAVVIVSQSASTSTNLALLGDKRFFFNEKQNAFVMYGIQGNSWVALGDPVGPAEETQELIWRFHEEVDLNGGLTVFYSVFKENLFRYLDLGLSPIKIGEEARVDLTSFSLDGGQAKGLRLIANQFQKQNYVFEIIPAAEVPRFMPALKKISDSWLAHKNTREKGFSLGFFDESYLNRFPVAVVRSGTQIVAFANLWASAQKDELSIDLMRYEAGTAPLGVMDYLFTQVMLWGRSQGYHWFNLGLAPFSGMEDRTLAPLWNRLGSFLFQHGEHFYNFQGLRQYKEKFHPVWEPKYLVSRSGFALPRILTDIAALIAGGVKGIISK